MQIAVGSARLSFVDEPRILERLEVGQVAEALEAEFA